MNFNHIIIRYGEMALKGKNRSKFTNRLQTNVKFALKEFEEVKIRKAFDRMFVELNGVSYRPVFDRLKQVFGIQSLSLGLRTEKVLEDIQAGALVALLEAKKEEEITFKVESKRSDKTFPVGSQKLNHEVGGHLLRNCEGLKVDVHNPDVTVKVEVIQQGCYITCLTEQGAGGLPVGTSGKAMLMLSGGIDSPVAGYLTMKRGVRIEAVHFHSPPYTSERAKQKVIDLAKKLTRYGGRVRLHVVPFTELQQTLHREIPDSYSMTALRRMMLRITEELAKRNDALAIATGESVGQVASQTLDSMHTINEVTNYPVLRPLMSMDKLDIIDIAQEIDTYDISIRPYEDCCTIFLPSAPKTKPKREAINRYESKLDIDSLVQEVVERTEFIDLTVKEAEEHQFDDLL
ncbi:tRNA uracil 4-sulfurtransferase ThiI [Bacillus solimangrovi]|uniref:Probable tRNA sulfurtransferase n=1 Tax=Bacillus solimangrovi TaxID=1305675 RepID=A0A1E5LCK4_9BACI|nr:tRNA uracil 4-sulfurtransferase ThiI [Bacillus solimangrovi]OEH91812.1 tRNA 4-thiouridine(8) synthase ThiI [Bacillus solimangrovi]